MGFLGDVWNWFGDGSHWSGNDGVIHRLTEHVQISIVSIAAAALIALPIGFLIGHVRKGGIATVNISNIGRALPSFALLILMVQIFGLGEPSGAFSFIGSFPTFVVLVAIAIPPMITNTYIGMVGVDPEVREAARGMGMSGRQLLRGVEAPIALPLVWAGIRTGAIAVVATATLAAYTGWAGSAASSSTASPPRTTCRCSRARCWWLCSRSRSSSGSPGCSTSRCRAAFV